MNFKVYKLKKILIAAKKVVGLFIVINCMSITLFNWGSSSRTVLKTKILSQNSTLSVSTLFVVSIQYDIRIGGDKSWRYVGHFVQIFNTNETSLESVCNLL